MSGRFEGRVAVVTGGAKGIGRAVTSRLSAEGAKLVVVNRDRAALEAAVAELKCQGREALAVSADVSDSAAVEALAARVLETYGRVDILVNNAGMTRDGLLLRMGEEDWDAVLDVNLKGTFLCTREFTRAMIRQRWGRVVNLSSVIGLTGNAGQANYAASKSGLVGLARSVSRELGGRGITANVVAPGFIETEMTAVLPEEQKKSYLANIPAGRFATAEEVASVVRFVASDDAAYITGAVIPVDGGLGMGH